MKNKYLLLFFTSNVLIILDQYTKFWVSTHIPQGYSMEMIRDFFSLTHIRNPGVAFGLFADNDSEFKSLIFIIFSAIAIVAILIFFHQAPRHRKIVHVGLIMVFSGAIGNLIDRILYQEVIDFLDFFYNGYHWPAFNVADSCITVGVVFMFIDLFQQDRASPPAEVSPTDSKLEI